MSRLSAKLLCAAATVFAFAAAPASAQTVTRIVAFGDSYADDGNLFQLIGQAPPAVYANGRFSNGTNFVDTMGQILGVPIDNFAIGGAFTGNGNINGPGIPGFVTEYQSFLAGGGPAAFPRVSGRFAPTDLVVVSIGGNDARAYERSLGLAPTAAQIQTLLAGAPAQAAQRVTETTAGLTALVNAGARNITFLSGDVGRLPEVAGLPIAQVGTAYASAYSNGVQAPLASFASQGVIVNYLDLSQIGNVVSANPSAFGLQSAGACPVTCLTANPELLDKYLFYVDQLHLTSAGFAIVGRYAVRQLEAPLHLAAQTESGLQAGGSFGRTLSGRLDLARTGDNDGLHFFVSGSTASRDFAASTTSLSFKLDTTGASVGAEYGAGPIVVGIAGNYMRGRADMSTASGHVRTRAWQAGAYAGWSLAGAFVQGYAGYGSIKYRIERDAVIDQIVARPGGNVMSAGAKAGYLVGAAGFSVGPVVALDYGEAKVDAYTEAGDPVLTLNVGRQKVKALLGRAGLELRGNLSAGGLGIRPYLEAAAEKDLEGDGRTIHYAGTASPTIVNSWVLPDRPKDVHGRLTGGAELGLGSRAALQLQGSATLSQKGGNEIGGFVAFKLGL
jgi:uncharacterized protein YhjY with autotransporter beta-barrel domain/phospholipase/lecithinase/hemolysin